MWMEWNGRDDQPLSRTLWRELQLGESGEARRQDESMHRLSFRCRALTQAVISLCAGGCFAQQQELLWLHSWCDARWKRRLVWAWKLIEQSCPLLMIEVVRGKLPFRSAVSPAGCPSRRSTLARSTTRGATPPWRSTSPQRRESSGGESSWWSDFSFHKSTFQSCCPIWSFYWHLWSPGDEGQGWDLARQGSPKGSCTLESRTRGCWQ